MAKEIELEEVNIIIRVPKDALKITIKAQLPDRDGEIIKVKRKLTKTDIDAARKAFLDNIEDGDDYNAGYITTEKGLAYMSKLLSPERPHSLLDDYTDAELFDMTAGADKVRQDKEFER